MNRRDFLKTTVPAIMGGVGMTLVREKIQEEPDNYHLLIVEAITRPFNVFPGTASDLEFPVPWESRYQRYFDGGEWMKFNPPTRADKGSYLLVRNLDVPKWAMKKFDSPEEPFLQAMIDTPDPKRKFLAEKLTLVSRSWISYREYDLMGQCRWMLFHVKNLTKCKEG